MKIHRLYATSLVSALLLCCTTASSQEAPQTTPAEQKTRIQKNARALGAAPLDQKRLSVEALAKALGRKADPKDVFFLVRDQISFEPYTGNQRGARGALLTLSGNSLDQSLLLRNLLRGVGHDARIVYGNLSKADGTMLLKGFVGAATFQGKEDATPRNLNLSSVKRHYWVEIKIRNKWTPADPTVPRSVFGIAPTSRTETTDEIHPNDLLKTRIALRGLENNGATRDLLTLQKPAPDIAFQPLGVQIQDFRKTQKRATLSYRETRVQGEPYIPSNFKRLWFEISTTSNGKPRDLVSRDLPTQSQNMSLEAFDTPSWSIQVLPGWVYDDLLTEAAANASSALVHHSARLVEKKPNAPQALEGNTHISALQGLLFANLSDQATLGIAREHGVRAFYEKPRVLIGLYTHEKDGQSFLQMDLRQNAIAAMRAQGIPTMAEGSFQALRGRLDTQLSGQVLAKTSDYAPLRVDQLFDRLINKKSTLVTLSPDNFRERIRTMDLPEETRKLLTKTVKQEGKAVLLPSRNIKINGRTAAAWWEISQEGQWNGADELGTRGASILNIAKRNKKLPSTSENKTHSGLQTLDKLTQTLVDASSNTPDLCSALCQSHTSLQNTAPLLCEAPPVTLQACLEPPQNKTDKSKGIPLIADLRITCEDATRQTRCGATYAATLTTPAQVSYTTPPQGSVTGPWRSPDLTLPSLTGCACTP